MLDDDFCSLRPEETLDSFCVQDKETDLRFDKLLVTHYPQLSRTYMQDLIENGYVLVNGLPAKKRSKLEVGDEVEIHFAITKELNLEPQNIPLKILYEDDYLLAIDKPAAMVVHPAPGNWNNTFVNALLFYCKDLEKGDDLRPGIVHRLDKDTTGVLLAAKTVHMHRALVELFSTRKMQKMYKAICAGMPKSHFEIDAPIGRHPSHRKMMTVCENGKPAKTECWLRATSKDLSLLDVDLKTGRTHQIRVHLKHIGHPILGDMVYGNSSLNNKFKATRQMLHSESLSFIHPVYNKPIVITAEVPEDMMKYCLPMQKVCQ
jgi:23S rRNA pseudouridine1911/1915/1917 synthase